MLRIKTSGLNKFHLNWLVIFQYAFILCVILNFRSIWLHTDSLASVGRIIKLLMGLSVVGGVIARKKFSSHRMLVCFAVMACLIVYWGIWYLADSLKSGSMITILVQFLAIVVYCLLVEDSVDDTMRKFTNIVLVIAAVSLFFWVFGSLLGRIPSTGSLYTTWTDDGSLKKVRSYYGIYFETQSGTFFGLTVNRILRNTAIFTEAPMASFVFFLAFLYELLMREKLDWKRCVILAAAVISTISTTGVSTLIIAIGLRYVFTRSKTKGGLSLKLFILPMAFVVALVALSFLLEQKLGTSSGSVRVDDFAAGYKAWMDAPLFGNGYGNTASYKQYMSSFRSHNQGFSNSLMQVLAYGGIYLFLPYCIAAFRGLFRLARGRQWIRMAFYVVFIYAFVITICPFQMLTFYLFISMARERKAKGVKKAVDEPQIASVPVQRRVRIKVQ
ncbi:hypothetical protein HMPREF1090_02720 [[Clostridium] clostridioforme 90A8]|uniref:O-antigen polymerase n=1 Tax=[Clostridium] clostridioforme 90A8 TaxID=999408 RepID=A0A0E2H9S0_9FIRM|nr:hypothetical protein HMPREF1090_02720 [[Clostridium] clostridioforme 90A8]